MNQFKVIATVQILATRTFYVDAESEEDAKRLPFDTNEDVFSENPVTVAETFEDEVTLISIKAIEHISQ